ncbi:MAG: hypothetical protein ACKO8T_00925 [Actinomycetota bacterium]
MRSERFLVRRLVVPIITLGLIVVPSYSWLRAGHVPGKYVNRCQAQVFEDGAPAAELLLIGASRTGFGIDDDLVDLRLSATEPHRTEKIVLLGNAESDANMALRTYLRERGAPRNLGIEILITRTTGDSAPARFGADLTNRSYALFGADAYSGYLGALVDRDVIGLADVYARSHLPSPAKFFFEHLQIGFDNAYRNIDQAVDPLGHCTRTVLPVWGPVAAAPYTDATPQPTQRKLERLARESERYVPINVDSRRASGEIAAMRDMVKIARSAGVRNVFFYYFPSFGEPANVIDLQRVSQLVPGAGMFDARPVVSDPNKPGLDLQFQDRAHLTKYGAYEVTDAFVDFLEGLKK